MGRVYRDALAPVQFCVAIEFATASLPATFDVLLLRGPLDPMSSGEWIGSGHVSPGTPGGWEWDDHDALEGGSDVVLDAVVVAITAAVADATGSAS